MTRTPIAEKLAELRAQIARIEATPRKAFTKAQRRQVYEAFEGRCGCGCDEPLDDGPWSIDHAVPLALGGAHEPPNWVPKLDAHHRLKTASDLGKIAKAKRLIKRETEGPKPSRFKPGRKLQSRGFDKTKSRKFSGQVVPRKG